MTTPSRNHHHPNQATTSKPPPKPTPTPTPSNQPNPQPNPNNPSSSSSSSSPFTLSQQDLFLSRASHLTRHELLKRRSHNLKQLSKCYRDHYWALMEDLKSQYRDYYWKFGVSPFKEDQNKPGNNDKGGNFMGVDGGRVKVEESTGDNNVVASDIGGINRNNRCLFVGCTLKAMALTSFCHLHILSDLKQKLYEPCSYVIKRPQAGPLTCGKPILKNTTPALCAVHFQNAQKHVNRALKKAGLPSASTKVAPKFHVIIAEYVRQIQAKRRVAKRRFTGNGVDKGLVDA